MSRGEDDTLEGGGVRQRRPKGNLILINSFTLISANFNDDFVYDDSFMKASQAQKISKDSTNPAVPS